MQKGDSEKIASSIFVCSQAKGCWIMPVVVVTTKSNLSYVALFM